MKKIALITLLFLAYQVKAQDIKFEPFDWSTQPDSAKWYFTILADEMRVENYKNTEKPLNWVLKNTPNLHTNLYHRAKKCYDELILLAQTKKERKYYKQKSVEMESLRRRYFE